MFRKPVFWIVFGLISFGCVIFTFRYFAKAFPIVTLDLQMDRKAALESARSLAEKYNWGPEKFRQTASFGVDINTQNFVELEAGGNEAFRQMLGDTLYSPYNWRVRHFKEGEVNETLIRFTPRGDSFGFSERLSEDDPGPSISPDSARSVAETTAVKEWRIDLTAYELIEESQNVRPGGRTDHVFVYERPDIRIGDGYYRLRLVVGGDKLTGLNHFIKVPEAFSRRYDQMRSTNNILGSVATVAIILFYVIGGCIIGLFFLLRQRWVIWRKPLFWGIFVAFLQLLEGINGLPLTWMDYDTAVSIQKFLMQQSVLLLGVFLFSTLANTLIFMAAESLSRKAFSQHHQFWRLWSPDTASSPAVLGRTIGGYLLVSVDLAFVVVFYFLTTKVFGWWNPSGPLFHPDVLATYFPWLTSIANSLQAGFFEECLFRAIPIAGAALIGQRLGHRRLSIVLAFVIQAVIFGAGHAAYPNQPAYARVVELIIPSLIFGLLYLYLGLLPAILMHFAYDLVLMALPLFVSAAPDIWIDKAIVVILGLVPLWVIIYGRLRTRRWSKLTDKHFNRSWIPPVKDEAGPVEIKVEEPTAYPSWINRWLPIGGLLGLIIWLITTNFQNEAIEEVREILSERGLELPEPWQELSNISVQLGQDDRFVWREGGTENYKFLMNEYLDPPAWNIRYAQFEGDIAERAEEYQFLISGEGELISERHLLPEARPGSTLSKEEALAIADSVLAAKYDFRVADLKEISAKPSKRPARTDWAFTFADTVNYPLEEGRAEIRVSIAGDEVAAAGRNIHVPEEWIRDERSRMMFGWIIGIVAIIMMVLISLAGVIAAIINWSRKNFSVSAFIIFFSLLFGIQLISFINNWVATVAQFSTARPLSHQTAMAIIFSILGSLLFAAAIALIVGFIQRLMKQEAYLKTSRAVVLGVSAGVLMNGISAIIDKFAPTSTPFWAQYTVLNASLPTLEAVLNPLGPFILAVTLVLLFFTYMDRFSNAWTLKKIPFAIVILLLVLMADSRAAGNYSVSFWLVSGVLNSLVIILLYIYILRFHLALIPIVFGASSILEQARQGALLAYPGAAAGALISIVLVGLLSIYWHKKLLSSS
jgi:membrane protease YdiL (CAAX protease family)